MHYTYIGVVKKHLELGVKGKKYVQLLDAVNNDINNNICNSKTLVPSEYSRLPRFLNNLFLKDYRVKMFFYYIMGKLKQKLYAHFLCLVTAIRTLVTLETCRFLNVKSHILN